MYPQPQLNVPVAIMATANISGARRKLKNVAYNYTPTQVKVREATSNDPWGPSSSLMSEIADLTNNPVAFTEIMEMVWKRINDHGKNWRHVYKSLVLLDYLIKCGSEKVAQQCIENIYTIETLKDFQHIEDNKDQGHNIRTKAAQMVAFLKDEEKLKNERAKAQMARKRFAQNNIGISSDGSTHGGGGGSGSSGRRRQQRPPDTDLEEARPTSAGEEELQLQIALALSREEAEKEDEARKGDDIRYQMALEESKQEGSSSFNVGNGDSEARNASPVPGTSQSALDDLLGLTAPSAAANDPWAPPPQAPVAQPAAASAQGGGLYPSMQPPPYPGNDNNDPWASGTSQPPQPTQQQPPLIGVGSIATNDPWAPVSGEAPAAAAQPQQQPNMLDGPAVDNDPWAPATPVVTNGAANAQNDVWSMDALSQSIGGGAHTNGISGQQQRAQDLVAKRGTTKTPENFLGENSALVNLDDLMGPSKPPVPGMGPTATAAAAAAATTKTAASNPFLSSTGPAVAPSPVANPFLAAQRPSPTLNQMRQPANQPDGQSNTNWAHQQQLQSPLKPAQADNNPFA